MKDVYASIEQDPRHKGLMLVVDEDVEERLFPNWSMNFEDLTYSQDAKKIEGYNAFFGTKEAMAKMREKPNVVWILLKTFQETIR